VNPYLEEGTAGQQVRSACAEAVRQPTYTPLAHFSRGIDSAPGRR